jgi:hypothetical protein
VRSPRVCALAYRLFASLGSVRLACVGLQCAYTLSVGWVGKSTCAPAVCVVVRASSSLADFFSSIEFSNERKKPELAKVIIKKSQNVLFFRKDYDPTGIELNNSNISVGGFKLDLFKFQDRESLSKSFGLSGIHDFGPRFLDKTIGGIWSAPDLLSEMNETQSTYGYVNGNPLLFTDYSGMMADSTGGGSGRLPGAPESASANSWYQKAANFMQSDGPAYNEMSQFRQQINDFGNSSFIRNISDWNPYYHGMNAISGFLTGKNIFGDNMGGGSIAMAALSAVPFMKITKIVGKSSLALSKASGKAMETALGMTASKVGIKVAGKTRFPDRLSFETGILEEAKNVKHLNFSSQLRDYLTYSQGNGFQMILHTRQSSTFSKPLQQLINSGAIKHNFIILPIFWTAS